jgi:hypothetical protein
MENAGFFKDDASLPTQYWETFGKRGDIEPEKRLFAAVLDDAVKSYRKLVVVGGRRFAEEEAWLLSDDKKATFSFCNICDVLGLSATRIRRSLRNPAPDRVLILTAADPPQPPRRATYRRARKAADAEMRA